MNKDKEIKQSNNYLKPFFEDVDYSDIELIENIINDEALSKLKDDGKSGNTINKYHR